MIKISIIKDLLKKHKLKTAIVLIKIYLDKTLTLYAKKEEKLVKNYKFKKFKKIKWFYEPSQKEKYQNYYFHNEDLKHKVIAEANDICSDRLSFLGFEKYNFGDKVNWCKDYKSGYKWAQKYYKDYFIDDITLTELNAEIKNCWDLSRLNHFFTLGKAYLITSREIYSLHFKKQVLNWQKQNKFCENINWTNAMEVSIRAINLVFSYFFFFNSPSLDEDFWNNLNILLYLHGIFIYDNLERSSDNLSNNHYISDLVGLIFLGLFFRNETEEKIRKKANKWLTFSLKELDNEIKIQVNDDGTSYENSTAYHRFVAETLLITLGILKKNNYKLSTISNIKIEKMFDFMMNLMKPNGYSPLIGDSDDGRLIIASNYHNWKREDFRNFFGLAGDLFNRKDFYEIGKKYPEELLWFTGNQVKKKKKKNDYLLTSKSYEDGGFYLLKNKNIYICIRCGETSVKGKGTHSHNEQLSFELNYMGKDFIIDPGTYVYTADYKMRNYFKSTKMHNTVIVDNTEQNKIYKKNIFKLKDNTKAKCIYFAKDKFIGTHEGYKEQYGVIHEREIQLNEKKLEINDRLLGEKKNKTTCLNLILDPKIEIIKKDNSYLLKKDDLNLVLKFKNDEIIKIKSAFISKKYQNKIKTKKIMVFFNDKLNSFLEFKEFV